MGKAIIVTHGNLAECLYEAAGLFLSEREGLSAICLGEDLALFKENLRAAILEDEETDILLMADLFGGSPFNIAASLLPEARAKGKHVEILTGVNLPMILEIIPMITEQSGPELKEIALEAGKTGIRDLIAELNRR